MQLNNQNSEQNNAEDIALIEKYLLGDEQSLSILFSKYFVQLYNFIFRFVNSVSVAEDLTQETLIKTWRFLNKFNKNKKFKTWIFQIAKNTAIDYIRKNKLEVLLLSNIDEDKTTTENEYVDTRPLILEILQNKESGERLRQAVGKLPTNYQLVLELYYQNDLNFREVSEVLGESVDTIKSRHRRALLMLKKELSKANN